MSLSKKNILGIEITDASRSEILKYIDISLANNASPYYIVTPNPEMLVAAQENLEVKRILNEAKIALCDGVGVLITSYLLGKPLKERFTGVDMVYKLAQLSSEKLVRVGFLGGRHSVAKKAADCLQKQFPGMEVILAEEEWKNEFNKLDIDILFVAFGFPKQEIWIASNLEKTKVKIAIGVGGALDYISKNVRRAPYVIRFLGLEWLFRLCLQPWRIRRQLSLIRYIYLVGKEVITRRNE